MPVVKKTPAGERFPLVIEPERATLLRNWIGEAEASVRADLVRHGALLFRGFPQATVEDMNGVADALDWPIMPYVGGTAPRTALGGKVHTSTEIAPHVPIPIHSDMSYAKRWPEALMLQCLQPARRGGATPVADMADVYDALPRDLTARWEEKELRIVRIAPKKAGLFHPKNWQDMYMTSDKREVEARCEEGATVEWLADDTLVLSTIQAPSVVHAPSGRRVWFNQANVFHRSLSREFFQHGDWLRGFGLSVYEMFAGRLPGLFRYPYDVTFADGSRIPSRDIAEIRRVIRAHTRTFDWKKGDVLLVDNVRMGHGRNPFRGERRVAVVMFEQTARLAKKMAA